MGNFRCKKAAVRSGAPALPSLNGFTVRGTGGDASNTHPDPTYDPYS